MHKKLWIILPLLVCGVGGPGVVFAETPRGFGAELNLDFDAFRLDNLEKSDEELRYQAARNTGKTVAWPFGGYNWYTDSTVVLTYNRGIFGGEFSLNVSAPSVNNIFLPKIGSLNGWIRPFDWFKLTAGLYIPSEYIDNLDADPGMRIYNGVTRDNWDGSRNPDNITQDEGVLLEGFAGPVTIGFAGRYYMPNLFSWAVNPSDPDDAVKYTKYAKMEQATYSFGGRAGYDGGGWGKVNASYIVEYANNSGNNYTLDRDNNVVPNVGRAEVTSHLFGLYASLTPLSDLGLTLGYNGIYTKYLDEFYSGTGDNGNWHKTALPWVYRQAVNLNARYKGVPRWTFRTDNNVSFWTDKDYTIYDLTTGEANYGLVTETQGSGYADVDHLLIWNGLGVKYELTPAWRLELYARNLYRRDTARGAYNNIERELAFTRNMVSGELKGVWQPLEDMEFSMGLVLENTVTIVSEDVHKLLVGRTDGFTVAANVRETTDTNFVFRIPLKMIIRIR